MFTKTIDAEQEMKKVESQTISSIIDGGMTVSGEIRFKGKVRIDGTVTGDIEGEHLILSETGKIKGDVSVVSFNCQGELDGNATAGMLTARKGCSIKGKIETESLTVEPGALLEGEIKVAKKGGSPEPVRPQQQPANKEDKK
ncbi:MAG: cell shape determination protein CcmA [Deltaproteobacteria bacterium]|nr:MAG: cell shape determination protein CcmA [Desulfobacterales bacterium]PIE73087.1 MAG: cell shape determination protein CcmA [Deltaproteobacteria bacterium]